MSMRYMYVALPEFTCAQYMLKYACVNEHMCYAYVYITHIQTLDHTHSYVCVYIYVCVFVCIFVCVVCVCTRTLKPCNDELVSIRFNYKGRPGSKPFQHRRLIIC